MSINWQDEAFMVNVTPGTGDMIKLSYDPAIPPGSCAGLIVGPGPTLVPGPTSSSMAIQPSLTWYALPGFRVLPPTACHPVPSRFSAGSAPFQPRWPVTHDQRVEIMVLPYPVDSEIGSEQAFALESGFLEQAQRTKVVRNTG